MIKCACGKGGVEGRASHLTSLLLLDESAPTWAFAALLHFNFLITCCSSVFAYKDVCVYQRARADALFNTRGARALFRSLHVVWSNTGRVKVTPRREFVIPLV
jgi:hypothetical protein